MARDAEGTMRHSRGWHEVMNKIKFGGLPVVSAMMGAVIGGGHGISRFHTYPYC